MAKRISRRRRKQAGAMGVRTTPQLLGLQIAAVAACAARWFSAAGSHIAFPACPTDVAREEGSSKAGFLAAAMELRDLLAQSSDGRQALRDLGFEPFTGRSSGDSYVLA